MNPFKTSKLLLYLIFLLTCSCAKNKETQVDEIFAKWNSNKTPGAAVAVVKDGKIIYKSAYGMANLEYGIPNSTETIFHIASVSKQFTVFSILLLAKEGKLSLEDDVRKFIPDVPDFGKTITLRHLANHTSGLRDQWNLLALAGWRLDDVITKDHVLKLVSKQKDLNFEPGDEYLYCNTGFTLLAEVVAKVSGKSFAEFTKANIFQPLGMNSTLFYDDHERIVPNRAYSYKGDSTGYKKSVLSYANVGATSLFTTVEDLSLWVANFSKPKVGDSDLIDEMNTPAVLNNGENFGGALGQFVGEYNGQLEISHGGADAGYRTYLARYPEQDLAVIVFSNDASFSSGSVAHQVADIFLEGINESWEEKEQEEGTEEIEIDLNTLLFYAGDYELEPGYMLSVKEDDGRLSLHPTGDKPYPLKALSKTEFKVGDLEFRIEFLPDADGKTDSLKLHSGSQPQIAVRTAPFDPTTVNLSEYVGSYFSCELSTTYHFVVDGDILLGKHSRHPDIHFNPLKPDIFSGNIWFFGQAEFVRNDQGTITGLKASSGRVRNIKFEKV